MFYSPDIPYVCNLTTILYTTLCIVWERVCDVPAAKWIGFDRICQVYPNFFFSSHVLWPPYRQTIHLGKMCNRRKKTYKACYPLLRGILRVHTLLWRMGSLWIFFCNSERITHCFAVVVFFFLFWWVDIHVYFSICWVSISIDLIQVDRLSQSYAQQSIRCCLRHVGGQVICVATYDGHSRLRRMRE